MPYFESIIHFPLETITIIIIEMSEAPFYIAEPRSTWWIGYESDGSSRKLTIRDQLAQLVEDRDDEFSIPLGKNLKKVSEKFLTISQKRNIRRQAYLNEVSERNDSVFFATIGAFVILPPFIILGIAVLTGYVQLFPWQIFLFIV